LSLVNQQELCGQGAESVRDSLVRVGVDASRMETVVAGPLFLCALSRFCV